MEDNKDSKYRHLVQLCKSIAEEATALGDYLCRSEIQDQAGQALFEHIAGEEAKHLAMFISKLASEYKPLEEALMKYQVSEDPLENEDD